MASTPRVYLHCDANCKFEGMTKEQILSAIEQAVSSGEIKDVDAGFITTIKTINNISIRFFYGEKSAYDALSAAQKENLFPIITNDTSIKDINEAIEILQSDLQELKDGLASGEVVVAEATSLTSNFQRVNITTPSGSSTSTLDIVIEPTRIYIFLIKSQEDASIPRYHTHVLIVPQGASAGTFYRSTEMGGMTITYYNGKVYLMKGDAMQRIYDAYVRII